MPARKSKAKRPRYALIIEDNGHHAELITEVLDRYFAPIIIHTVDTIDDGIEFAGQTNYDLIIAAGIVKENPITDFVGKLTELVGNAPLIVISGRGDEHMAAQIIKRGATEYLVKTRETLENLPTIIQKHLSHKRSRRQKRSKTGDAKHEGAPSTAVIIKEVDRLTQQALAIAGRRRRTRSKSSSEDIDHLDKLLGQIQRLRELAAKFESDK